MDDMTNDQMGPQPQNGPTQPPNPPAPPPQPQAAPATPPSGSPAGAPAQATGTPAAPQPPPPPGSFFHNLSHSLIGAVLGHSLDAVAGKNVTTGYNTDDSGKQTPVVRPMTTGEKLKSIAARALQGLAAGAEVPQQKSGLAGALAGLGAGAKAGHQADLQEDARKRQLSTDEFEREQKATLQKADILRANALTMSTYYANKKAQNDMDPSFARHQSTYDAAMANPDFAKHTHEMTDAEVTAAQKNDKNFSTTHLVAPLGWAPSTDADGNQLLNPDGSPQFHMRMSVIDGTQKGNWVIQPDEEKDIHEYGPMANIRGADNIKAGDTYPFEQYLALDNAVKEQKKNVLQGWQHSTVGFIDQNGKQVPVEVNGFDQTRTRPFPGGVTPMAVETEQADIGEKKTAGVKNLAEAQKFRDEGAQALANAAQINSMVAAGGATDPALIDQAHKSIAALTMPDGSPNIAGQAALRSVKNPVTIASLLAVANYDSDLSKVFPTRTTAKSGQLDAAHAAGLVRLINPDWTEQGFKDVQNLNLDFQNPKGTGGQISSFNQFLGHSAQAQNVIQQYAASNSPLINKPLNWLRTNIGDPEVSKLYQAIAPVQTEYENFLKNNLQVNEQEQQKFDAAFNQNSAPIQMLAAMDQMGQQAISRLDTINERYKTARGTDYPNLLTPEGKAAAEQLGLDVSKYKSGGTLKGTMRSPQTGTSPAGPPAPTTHIFDPQAWKTANPQGDVSAAIAAAKQQGYAIAGQPAPQQQPTVNQ